MKKKTTKKKVKRKITKNMTFHEVMQKYPQVTEVFLKNKMTCFGCVMARYETIEQGAIMHGIGVKRFVEELNKAAAKKKKK